MIEEIFFYYYLLCFTVVEKKWGACLLCLAYVFVVDMRLRCESIICGDIVIQLVITLILLSRLTFCQADRSMSCKTALQMSP